MKYVAESLPKNETNSFILLNVLEDLKSLTYNTFKELIIEQIKGGSVKYYKMENSHK